jgi:hypothetical protein
VNFWPRFLRVRWERREREADEAEARLAEARATDARVRRLTAEAVRIKQDGFTEAVIRSMGVRQ